MRIHNPQQIGCYAGWRRYVHNPQIDERIGTCEDPCVIRLNGEYRMLYTHVFEKKILTAMSGDGLDFRPFTDRYISDAEVIERGGKVLDLYYDNGGDYGYALLRRPDLDWETIVCQPTVVFHNGLYHMWYVGKYFDCAENHYITAKIGHATSTTAENWQADEAPCLVPDRLWEQNAVQHPSVLYNPQLGCFQMWYAAGDIDEPDGIGYAESVDGLVWKKRDEPVFTADHSRVEERDRVNGGHVVLDGGWYYLFYTAWQDPCKARICVARSRDGVSNWERHPKNPIVTWGQFGTWDCESASHPYPMHLPGEWRCYFTGRNGFEKRIGVLLHEDDDLGFPDEEVEG